MSDEQKRYAVKWFEFGDNGDLRMETLDGRIYQFTGVTITNYEPGEMIGDGIEALPMTFERVNPIKTE